MNKLIRSLLVVAVGALIASSAQAGRFSGTYTFSTANNDVPTANNGISFGAFSPTGVTADTWSSGTQRYGASGWATSLSPTAHYLSFVLTPSASGSYVLNTLSFVVEPIAGMNTTGGGEWAIYNGASIVTSGTFDLPASGGSSTITPTVGVIFSSALTIRLLGSAHDTGHTGDLAFDNVTASGISPVPEPVNVALGIFSGVFMVVIVTRSRPVRNRVQRCRVAAEQWINAV